MEIDIEKLRNDLMDYFGSSLSFYPNATMDLIEVENASDLKLIEIAISNNFDLQNYEINKKMYL